MCQTAALELCVRFDTLFDVPSDVTSARTSFFPPSLPSLQRWMLGQRLIRSPVISTFSEMRRPSLHFLSQR
jgi:hypothetical protein